MDPVDAIGLAYRAFIAYETVPKFFEGFKDTLAQVQQQGKRKRMSTRMPNPYKRLRTISPTNLITSEVTASRGNTKRAYSKTLGDRINQHITRYSELREENSIAIDKTLYDTRLISVPILSPTASDGSRYARAANDYHIIVDGVKLDIWLKPQNRYSTANTLQYPIAVRFAIYSPEKNDGSATVDATNFFNNRGGQAAFESNKSVPFNTDLTHWAMAGSLSDEDGRYLWEKTVILDQPASDGAAERMPINTFRHITKYIPIKKVLHFSDENSPFPKTNLYLRYWYWEVADNTSSFKYTTTTSPVDIQLCRRVYWRKAKTYE